jgi:DNA primase
MAVFSQATLERIRAASDIVDVIGTYLPLKRAGANFTGLCPFHKEKTPSFNVNPHRQIFHCFGCHKGGDVFTFVKEYENIGFMDSVRRLAERAKIPIEQDASPGEQQTRHLKDQLLEIHEKITQRWQNCLQNEAAGQLARDYLKKRGVGEEAIKLFRIGAAPESWDDTVNWAKAKDYDLALIEKAGLIIRKEETGSHYDRFRGRLMFPICDEQGRVVAFSGRVLSGDEKTAKYVNSPETAIFTKSKVFYGLDKSKRAILDAGFAIICEGQLDLIACFMGGVQNIVAPQGTAFTDQHARILKRYVNETVLCFDSDNAGQNAAVRSLDHLLASSMAIRVAVVPAPHDPDSFIKAFGGEKFRELINNAKGFFDYYLERLCQQNDIKTDKGRIIVVRSMLEALQKTQNRMIFDKHAHDLTFKLGLSFQSIVAEYKKILDEKPGERIEESLKNSQPEVPPPPITEFHLLKLLLLHDELVAWATSHLDSNWILHPIIRQIVGARLDVQKKGSWSNLAAFLDGCDSAEMRSLITEAATEERAIPNAEKQLADVVLKLRNQFLDRQIATVTQKAGLPEISDSEKIELLHEQKKLREQKRSQLTAADA